MPTAKNPNIDRIAKDFPPIQKPDTYTLDDALKAMSNAASGG